MRILLVHDYYQQRGGEDAVFEKEVCLLKNNGHQVAIFTGDNRVIAEMSGFKAGLVTLWNANAYAELRQEIRRVRPQVMHVHNTFPLLSPAVYHAAKRARVAVVQTLHNFRFVCSNGLLLREGGVCEECVDKGIRWPGVLHRCYRDDRLASSAVMTMQTLHKVLGSWHRKIDRFIAPSEFVRGKLSQGGFPREKIVVKPHFVDPDPGPGDGNGGFALFVGRLSREKGVSTMLRAWQQERLLPPLRIVGDGPMSDEVRAAAAQIPQVEWLGPLPSSEVLDLMGSARCLIVPSVCYETFSAVVVESFAKGTPVIASGHGALAENVREGINGFVFSPSDHNDLVRTIVRATQLTERDYRSQRAAARDTYEREYTAPRNLRMLEDLYRQAIGAAKSL